ncbi:glutathione S-transferase family protein [Caulobacter sp. NIBR2454]|uniref:glutathione S-transferase family protein n=1 Tax=Caulobacter sp. NIBR2454 TaxID=3015996 RepID=UPI0022B5F002|nr:glutathione S-transferase family protein [Caulobacter sp. NIBR2454]
MIHRPENLTVYGAVGSGSIAVEAALTLLGIDYELVEAPTWEGEAERAKVAPLNPLKQIPTLVFPDGEVMTESSAMLLWLADAYPEAGLAPGLTDPRRRQFLRWMSYIPASIYSMFWVLDEPSRLAAGPEAEAVIQERTIERIADCWRMMDEQVEPGTYIQGEQLTVLDLYVTVVSRWRPRRRRFYEVAPKLAEVVRRVDEHPLLQEFWAKRFPLEGGWEG